MAKIESNVQIIAGLLLGGCFDGSPALRAYINHCCALQQCLSADQPARYGFRCPPTGDACATGTGTPVIGGQSLQPMRNTNVVERRLNFRRDTKMGIGSPMGTGARLANARHLRSQCNHRHGGALRLQGGHGHPSDAARLPAASPHPDPAPQHSNLRSRPRSPARDHVALRPLPPDAV
jgi:hypothetical protein